MQPNIMIEFRHVSKALSGRCVLDDLSFVIERGEIFVIVGSSGAGKSVTLKHMVCLMRPDEGDILVDGESLSDVRGSRLEKIRERFGYLFQGGALLAWLTVAENVALPLREKTTMSEEEIQRRVRETLRRVGLEQDGHKFPSEISGGMQKRAGLARAIVRQAEIVLYDEPTSGLDPVTSRAIDALIRSLQQELGVTSVVVTHDLHSALSIGTRIAMLHRGKLVAIAPPAEFLRSSHPEVRAFLKSQFITQAGSWERNRS